MSHAVISLVSVNFRLRAKSFYLPNFTLLQDENMRQAMTFLEVSQ